MHRLHNQTTWNEKLFVGKIDDWYHWYLSEKGVGHYAINSLIILTTAREKYVKMYERCSNQLKTYAKAIRILSKGYLPISLLLPSKLNKILQEVKVALQTTNRDFDLVIERLYLYYDMKLVTFGIDVQRNLIIQFPVFIQPYTKQHLILHQMETVPVPIIDRNKQAQSYTYLKIDKPHIELNSEICISLGTQELATGKKVGYEFYCEELLW